MAAFLAFLDLEYELCALCLTGRLPHALSYTIQFGQAGDAGYYWSSNRAQFLIYPCTQVTGESLAELPIIKNINSQRPLH